MLKFKERCFPQQALLHLLSGLQARHPHRVLTLQCPGERNRGLVFAYISPHVPGKLAQEIEPVSSLQRRRHLNVTSKPTSLVILKTNFK